MSLVESRNSFHLLLSLLISCCLLSVGWSEISSGRIKGSDEPQIVSWRVLEGITEPFETSHQTSIPAWKQMKSSADAKAAAMSIQQALHEYGQILRHPYVFGEMPTEERYDIFLSMAKLLKTMGFHQRAELLLYEAISYTTNAFEAHFQLALLSLDKEDIEKAKLHLKNCLFYQDNDSLILIYLSTLLLSEGKIHESKFFLSRIVSGLEARVRKLGTSTSNGEFGHVLLGSQQQQQQSSATIIEYHQLSTWLEDLVGKVLHGEFRITLSSTQSLLHHYNALYKWISNGEFTGRIVFDLGQSLYEGGKAKIGHAMMVRGFHTSDMKSEGVVSNEIVRLRLNFEYPVVSQSISQVMENYLNMTYFLSTTADNYTSIDLENVMDMYWPIPLLGFSGLPMMPVLKELYWRFHAIPQREDEWSQLWLDSSAHQDIQIAYENWKSYRVQQQQQLQEKQKKDKKKKNKDKGGQKTKTVRNSNKDFLDIEEEDIGRADELKAKRDGKNRIIVPPASSSASSSDQMIEEVKVEIGIFGGHMNNHPVGQTILHRIMSLLDRSNANDPYCLKRWKKKVSFTLISLPLVPDMTTKRIASAVDKIINLPLDLAQARDVISKLKLDAVIFPDWQPFPDQLSPIIQSMRIAPVQLCLLVRGGGSTSCTTAGSDAIDYYLLPQELEPFYQQSVVAAASNARKEITRTVMVDSPGGNGKPTPVTKKFYKPLRPAWKESFAEQVVLLDWPMFTPKMIEKIVNHVTSDDAVANHHLKLQGSAGTKNPAAAAAVGTNGSPIDASMDAAVSQAVVDDMLFSPMDTEGKIFFENQPVAVIPLYPMYLHPLMDEILFKILRSVPALQIILAMPDSFHCHSKDVKHKMAWAREVVRRLWSRGGNLYHRIRLLPSPLSDYRLLQLLRQADLVFDTFPIGMFPYYTALALSSGTPVVTLRSGSQLHSAKDELLEARHKVSAYKDHPLRPLVIHQDLPWIPSMSHVAAFYDRLGLANLLVANTTQDYFTLASNILSNREFAYEIRVKVLDAIEDSTSQENPSTTTTGHKCVEDDFLGFVHRIGSPWAHDRQTREILEGQGIRGRVKIPDTKEETKKGFLSDFLRGGSAGTIVQ